MVYSTADRAQSESLGSLLLVAVVVISVGTFGAYYITATTDGTGGSAAGSGVNRVNLDVSATTDELELSHSGGASVSAGGLQIRVENASGEYTYNFSEGSPRGDGDKQFDPGETWRLTWTQSQNAEVTVSLVNGDREVVFRERVTVESATTQRPANPAS